VNNNILTYAEVFNGNYKSPTDRLSELANTKENKAKGYGYPILYRKAIDFNPKNDVFLKKYTYSTKKYRVIVTQRLTDWEVFINGIEEVEYFNEFPTLEFIKRHFYLN
jgi:hypothetical protein